MQGKLYALELAFDGFALLVVIFMSNTGCFGVFLRREFGLCSSW